MSAPRRAPVAVVLAIGLSFGIVCCSSDDVASRQADVAERGATVMPFDLDATTHTFTKTPTGGVQDVVAKDPADQTQLELIRQHLRAERDKFSAGDFDDPATIHGMDMPGVAELEAGYRNVTVSYADTDDGARLTYNTTTPALVDAIHAWFDRQVMDHGGT